MGRPRKKVTYKNDNKSSDSQSKDAENANGNCTSATVSRKRNVNKTARGRSKKFKASNAACADEIDMEIERPQNVKLERIQFVEDQDQIDFEVEAPAEEFLSDGEVNEGEDNPLDTSINRNVTSDRSSLSNLDKSREDDTTDGSELDAQNSRRPRSVVQRRSVEEKLDYLTSALTSMKDIMMKKGVFDENEEGKAKTQRKKGNVESSSSDSETTI